MTFTKAFVLSYTDFRILVDDFFEYLRELASEGNARDIRENPEGYIEGFFIEGILDAEKVEEFVIFINNDVVEAYRADQILRLIEDEYGDNWLDDVIGEYEDEDENEGEE